MSIQYQCIAYRVPPHEIENARNGVPVEQLEKLTEPQIFIPTAQDEKITYRSKPESKRSKAQRPRI